MSDAPAYQRRAFAWWELRGFLSKRLSHDDFVFLLAELQGPLDRWLWDKAAAPPLMAFDAKPQPRVVEMAIAVLAALVRGKFDPQTNNEIEKFLSEILAIDKEDVSASVLVMREAHNALMADGLIHWNMTIKDRYERVLERLGKEQGERGYGYENFRTNVVKS